MLLANFATAQRNLIRQVVTDTTRADLFLVNLGQGSDTTKWAIMEKIENYRTAQSGEITFRWTMPLTPGPFQARRMIKLRRQAIKEQEDENAKKAAELRRLRLSKD
ncbi:MAG: hypothetical protein ACRC3K_08330 [Plesiomonas sp.]